MFGFARSLVLIAALAAPDLALAQDGSGVDARCRSVATPPEGIRSFSDIRRAITGDVVRAQLCQDGGQWVYRVTVVSTSGSVRTILFDARSGSALTR